MAAPLPSLYKVYHTARDQWLFQLRDSEPGVVTLTMRRVFIVPTRPGLAFCGLLLVMLIGALNYNLGLGFALTFFAGACAVADMYLTAKNLAMLQLRRAARSRCSPARRRSSSCTCTTAASSIATPSGWASRPTASRARRPTSLAGGSSAVRLSAASAERGWLEAPRVRLVTRFPLGLFRAWSYWRPDLRVLVYPGAGDAGAAAAVERRGQRGRPRHRGSG
jgi:uncharacterized protein (DUF58 family)